MQIIKAVIVDDEEFAVIDIKDHLCAFPNIEIIGTYSNGQAGLEGINTLKPDLVFVDIEMPELNGFEMLGRLNYSPVVVFCTGYSKYAIDGYAYDPSDFLLKPIKAQRFNDAIQKVFKDLDRRNLEKRLIRQKQQVGYLLLEFRDLHGDSRKVYVWPDDILYVQPQEHNANYIEYQLEDGTCHVVKKTLKKALVDLEPKGFAQVHRSYLVNTSKIRELFKNETLILNNNPDPIQIPISRGYRKIVKQLIGNLHSGG
ncbi:MAG: LytTR family DNA-binding domain-containing protein [Proteobacteria bacterium]|nr:LytTR family DNA-binding domain-containing protein [Pseudomonadota bacterium]